MVDPSTYYETARMSVVVERYEPMWLICASRRQSEQFIGMSTVAYCDTLEEAQALARMLVGVEITREGAAIWPDGRTEQHPLAALYADVDEWFEGDEKERTAVEMLDWVRSSLGHSGYDTLCVGCSGKRYRLATRDDGERAVERCDTCNVSMSDDEALVLAGEEGQHWLVDGPTADDIPEENES